MERGYQRYVARDEASAYEIGPTRRSLKVKQNGWTLEEGRWQRRVFRVHELNAVRQANPRQRHSRSM